MRKLQIGIAAALLATIAFASPATTSPVEAAGCVSISKVYYDSPGADSGGNTSRNAEWIRLTNSCSSSKALTGWTIRDASGHVYKFGSYRLGARASVKVHTGNGTNTAANRYWGSRYYIWNNDGDTAKLKNGSGVLVDSCRFNGGAPGYVSC